MHYGGLRVLRGSYWTISRYRRRNADAGRNNRAISARMPLTVFDIKGVPGDRRERIETAVVAGGKHVTAPHEAWIASDPFKRGVRAKSAASKSMLCEPAPVALSV
jgi:hypothetical protein